MNLGRLEVFEAGTIVTPELLVKQGIVKQLRDGLKVLADGELTQGPDRAGAPLLREGQGEDRRPRRQGRGPRGVDTMLQALRNIWDIPDLRKRVLFTLGLLAVYRLGNHVPTPGINSQALVDFFEQNRGNWFGLVDMFSGGNLAKVTIFALGIMPYISASIILQLLTVVWPYLEKLSKEGELGRRKITQYTRYGTVLLSIVQSLGIAVYLERMTIVEPVPHRRQPRLGLPLHGRADADHRHRVHHVARRADHRARHRQRHVADHLRRHRGRLPARCHRHLHDGPARRPEPVRRAAAAGGHGRGGRRDRLRRARPAPDPGAVRQARGRPARLRRPDDPPAAARQHRAASSR